MISALVALCLFAPFEGVPQTSAGWQLVGSGEWETNAFTVTGTGKDSSYWSTANLSLASNSLYRVSFLTKADRATSGCLISGPNFCNRDFPVTEGAQHHGFAFVTPSDMQGARLRFGLWESPARIQFSNIRLYPTQAVHDPFGEGETMSGRRYRFRAPFDGEGANYSRPLASFRCGFNSNRWTFNNGSEVVYRHDIPGCKQSAASVEVGCSYHANGTGVVDASADGATWTTVARIEKTGTVRAELPDGTVFVRMRAVTKPANFQINEYQYTSTLDKDLGTIRGATVYPDIDVARTEFPVSIRSFENDTCRLEVGAPRRTRLSVELRVNHEIAASEKIIAPTTIALSCPLRRTGVNLITISVSGDGDDLYRANVFREVPVLQDASYGYALPTPGLWWCEGTYKVSQSRPLPATKSRRIELFAARNEYEPVQLVLRPTKELRNLQVKVTGLNARVDRVGYLEVTHPTDKAGTTGWWPDPLPPLEQGTTLEAGRNHPLWLTVYVPPDQKPGDLDGRIELTADGWKATVPVRLHVWDFTLPKTSHLQSGFGLNTEMIRRYHNLETRDELRQVLDLYLESFAAHRIAPYNPAPLDPYRVKFGETNAVMDFAAFDRVCEKWLDQYGFNSIMVRLEGVGGGTFFERSLGHIGKHAQGTPEYEQLMASQGRQLVEHLRQKGWLDKAYVYWFDEPAEKDFQFVADGMKIIQRAAPGLTRLITKQPATGLLGNVELWCPVVSTVDAKTIAERRKLGERFWWYLCCGPRAPYIGLFIDHPAVDLRVWSWLSRKWGVTGLLVWDTDYWTSATAFPPPAIQNPWQDPMAYETGYGKKPGEIGYWGNGDGRFLYPPNRDVKNDKQKYLSGPISSLRWEMLREGIEDYEYFALLDEQIAAAKNRGVSASLIQQAEQLALVPDTVVTDDKTYSRDPQPLHQHRRQVAEMIEQLNRRDR